MRNILVPMLLLASVALSTGVILPQLPSLQRGPDPISDQSSRDSNNQVTQCDVLRRLFRSSANWMFKPENNQEEYNEDIDKRHVNMYEYEPTEAEWFSYQKQYYQPQNFEREFSYDGDAYDQYHVQKWAHETPSHPPIDAIYSQNKDIFVKDGQAYYLYDTIMAARSPFQYFHHPRNCLYNSVLRSSSKNAQPIDEDTLEFQEERERLNTNEINPLAEPVVDKRDDVEEIGEKELPECLAMFRLSACKNKTNFEELHLDELIADEEDSGDVEKKLFSFWSRLQALSHKGHQLPTRRHTFAFYGPDGTRDGPLTAETRASHLRPPGQPLRWG